MVSWMGRRKTQTTVSDGHSYICLQNERLTSSFLFFLHRLEAKKALQGLLQLHQINLTAAAAAHESMENGAVTT